MNIKYQILVLVVSILFVGGCGKQAATDGNSNGQSLPPVQAEPFHGQDYKSLDGRSVLTLTSKEECDLTQDGTTLPCKYTKQTDALRVIATIMGTPQVLYFRFVDQGLQANDGQILLAPRQYADAMAQIEKKRKELTDSKTETETNATFTLPQHIVVENGSLYLQVQRTLILTDVSLRIHYVGNAKGEGNAVHDDIVLFSQIAKIHDLEEEGFTTYYGYSFTVYNNEFFIECKPPMLDTLLDQLINGKSVIDAKAIHDAVLSAYNAWKIKFPDAVLK